MTQASGTCTRCGEPFTYERPGPGPERQYCSKECRLDAKHEADRARRGMPPAQRQARPPELPPMPPAPDWSRAYCQRAPAHMRAAQVSASPRRVLSLTLVPWGGCSTWVRPGTVVDIPVGSALETAYGGSSNLSSVIPAAQRGQGDDLDRSAQAN